MTEQLTLFGKETVKPVRRTRQGGSANPIVFRDYESFVAKFTDNPKTTDDCYTPQDVYEAVCRYVATITDMEGKCILRPFFPGGDYENAEYPENGVVIDNPPFSMFSKIVKFYTAHGIPFFLFGPGMTIFSVCKWCTAVFINTGVTFSNGAVARIDFATNLLGDLICTTAPTLNEAIKACPSQNTKVELPKYDYPDNVLNVSTMQIIAGGGVEYSVRRCEAEIIRRLDLHPNRNGELYGDHLLVSQAQAKAKAKAQAKAQALADRTITIQLSEREKAIVERLSNQSAETPRPVREVARK